MSQSPESERRSGDAAINRLSAAAIGTAPMQPVAVVHDMPAGPMLIAIYGEAGVVARASCTPRQALHLTGRLVTGALRRIGA